jgi:hypothetical protein
MGVHVDERKSALAGRQRNRIGSLADSLAVKDLALSEVHDIPQGSAVERRNTRLDFDRAEPVTRLSPGMLVTLADPNDPGAVPNPSTASSGMLP